MINISISKKLKGSYTVEAALLLPFIFGIILLCIYTAFYVYNKATLTEYAYMAAVYGSSFADQTNKEITNKTYEQAEKLVQDSLLLTNGLSIKVKVDYNSVIVQYKTDMVVWQGLLPEIFNDKFFSIDTSMSAARIRKVFYMRNCKKLKEYIRNEKYSSEETEEGG